MYSLWCEWDVGQEYVVFSSEENALKWLRNNASIQGVIDAEEDATTVDDLIGMGLISINVLEVDPDGLD